MPRVLLVAQETGGVGKSTVTRGLAEAVPDAPILEIESVHRLTEFKAATAANEPGSVQHFLMRASREAIDASGGMQLSPEWSVNGSIRVATESWIDCAEDAEICDFGPRDFNSAASGASISLPRA